MTDFDKKVEAVLQAYHERIQAENALMKRLPIAEGMKRRNEFLLPVGKEVGHFLNQLAKASHATSMLEIGTSYGYSTIWLAEAARTTGGKLISLEIDVQKVAHATQQLTEAGLADWVEFRIGDALESIKQASETFDFVLIDIWKELYVPAFESFFPKLKPGAYVIADNMLHPPIHQQEAATYRAAVKHTHSFDSVLLPLGSGIEVSHVIR